MAETITASKTIFRPSAMFKRTIKELVDTVPSCKLTYKSQGVALLETPVFYIRILDNPEYVQIQMGERKTFDRWANSVNFVDERSKGRRHYHAVFLPQYQWAKRVLKSGLFNFNRYFEHLDLPWYATERNH